jgi:hypothetical protein
VLVDAQRLGVQPDEGVLACLVVLRAWAERIGPGDQESRGDA